MNQDKQYMEYNENYTENTLENERIWYSKHNDELISLNITDKNKNLIGNYTSDIDMCNRDNKKFNEIKDGKRNFGENIEKLRLKFILDNKIIRKINNDDYSVKLVFPCDSYNNKSKFIVIR